MATNKNINLNLTPIVIASLVGVIAIGVVIFFVIRKRRESKEDREYLQDVEKGIQKSDLTYTNSEYTQFANKLYSAMKGVGTNENAIYDVFSQMQTDSDVKKLISAFGSKGGMTLNEWLLDDLSNKELNKVNQILSKNNINLMF